MAIVVGHEKDTLRVVAIDPHPAKASAIWMDDGNDAPRFFKKERGELGGFLDGLGPETLLCWDAPLTGPRDPAHAGDHKQDFTKRVIEAFFTKGRFKTPKGISVGNYSGVSHWAISRALLGLPRLGAHCADYDALPFHLIPDSAHRRMRRPQVAEIHPAVAAWLWCRDDLKGGNVLKKDDKGKEVWRYKGGSKDKNPDLMNAMWKLIQRKVSWPGKTSPESDDEFDAGVGYRLGRIYLRDRYKPLGEREVDIVGSRETGAWLLPMVKDVQDAWVSFGVANRRAANEAETYAVSSASGGQCQSEGPHWEKPTCSGPPAHPAGHE